MAADWHFELRSEWAGPDEPYRLVLTNRGTVAIEGFGLGVSGPLRVAADSPIANGTLIQTLASYAQFAPPAGFVLAPGGEWAFEIARLDFPLRHWTDGATTGFVILADGSTVPARTHPPARPGAPAYRRGTMALAGESTARIAVIPWPNVVDVHGRRSPPQGLAPEGESPAIAAFSELTELLFPGEGLVRPRDEDGLPVRVVSDGTLGPEAYRIVFSGTGATVAAATPAGHLHGLVTLGQIARGARSRPSALAFPTDGVIEDAPAMGFRGCHLDVARRFYGRAEMARFLAILAWNKLDVLHWHLSDDEAWRVEIEAYPQLAEIGGWRGFGLPLTPMLGSGPERTGGVYSKQTVRALVAQAERFGIEIIPEIDVPGHSHALLTALPHLRDPGENAVEHSIQAFPNNCLNPAIEAVYPALETILGELAELFPGPRFHVGADEVPARAWASSPAANAMRAKLGVEGTAPLQAAFLRRVQAMLTRHGKITGAWEEAAHGGGIDKAASYLVGWVAVESSRKLAADGYDVVVAPGQAYYLDMANGAEWSEPGASWAGWSSPEKTYGFDPAAGWSEAERARLLGVQTCIWSEPMSERAVFDRLVFPRLSAMAETGWTAAAHKDYRRFAMLAGLMPNLYGWREGA